MCKGSRAQSKGGTSPFEFFRFKANSATDLTGTTNLLLGRTELIHRDAMETSPRRLSQICALHAKLALTAENLLQTFDLCGTPG